jgi:hypothetical protein
MSPTGIVYGTAAYEIKIDHQQNERTLWELFVLQFIHSFIFIS